MFIVFTVLIVVTCIFTILIVLVQNSKGGGLASNFSSSNQYMGVRKTADFLTVPVCRVSLMRPCWTNLLKPLICLNPSEQNLPKVAKNKPKRT